MLSTVNSLDGIEAHADWLTANGGSAINRVYITVAVAGNREDGVRIVDVRPIAKCSAPLTGVLFYAPPQGRDNSIRLQFDLDQADRKTDLYKRIRRGCSLFSRKHGLAQESM